MNIKSSGIIIELREDDIADFYNVIAFALDLDAEKKCMTDGERKMANKLLEGTKYY